MKNKAVHSAISLAVKISGQENKLFSEHLVVCEYTPLTWKMQI